MPSYLIKPREPTVLSHKEHQELSSTNLLLSMEVSPPLPNSTLRRHTNSPIARSHSETDVLHIPSKYPHLRRPTILLHSPPKYVNHRKS